MAIGLFPRVVSGIPKTKSKTMPIALLPMERRNLFNADPEPVLGGL